MHRGACLWPSPYARCKAIILLGALGELGALGATVHFRSTSTSMSMSMSMSTSMSASMSTSMSMSMSTQSTNMQSVFGTTWHYELLLGQKQFGIRATVCKEAVDFIMMSFQFEHGQICCVCN